MGNIIAKDQLGPKRFCEFTGDVQHKWDEVGYKKKCEYISINDSCLLYKKPLGEFDGWRICCKECTKPIQIVVYK
jgi:hypothetical protein